MSSHESGGVVDINQFRQGKTALISQPAESIKTEPLPNNRIELGDLTGSYCEMGEGDPIVFLHGAFTHSYTWRNIMPELAKFGRCIAPDFLGMGDADALAHSGPDSYHYREQCDYLDELLKALDVTENVTLVVQDFASMFGCDWAYRNQSRVKGIVHYGGVFTSGVAAQLSERGTGDVPVTELQDFVLESPDLFEGLAMLAIDRTLDPVEMEHYNQRYREPGESRRPIQRWISFAPLPGEIIESSPFVACYTSWMKYSRIPKLWIKPADNKIVTPGWDAMAKTFANQTAVEIPGNFLLTEDNPQGFLRAVNNWLETLPDTE